jgi:hypothetical protein
MLRFLTNILAFRSIVKSDDASAMPIHYNGVLDFPVLTVAFEDLKHVI